MSILPSGSANANSIIAPGVYVYPVQPQPPGGQVPTNIIGIVGSASWGPVNSPVIVGSLTEYIQIFGAPKTLSYDMGTQVMGAASVGAQSFVCVRVTDGTEEQAEADLMDVTEPTAVLGAKLIAKYSGSVANSIKIIVSTGTNSTVGTPTYKVSIIEPVGTGTGSIENFDNIGGAGNALWVNIVNAINQGQGELVPPSNLVTAEVGAATGTPDLATYTMSGGADGSATVDESDLVGVETDKSGMYALKDTGLGLLVLSNASTSSNYGAVTNFSESQGAFAILTRPSNESYTDGITAKKAIGLDNAWGKLMVGDWVLIQDPYNNVQRYVSPQSFVAGTYSLLANQQSGLNKPISSSILISTQTQAANQRYTSADIADILLNGLDVIASPSPGGSYYALQTGKNTSSNILTNGDQYTRLTNYILLSLEELFGAYIGTLQTPAEIRSAKTAAAAFLHGLYQQQVIGSTSGGIPYQVDIDSSQSSKGIQTANIKVAFFGVIVVFIVAAQTGLATIQSVQGQ